MKLEDTGQSKSFAELLTPYLFAFQRYWKLAFGPALVVAVLAMLLARKLPDYFMADAVIFIQPPRITSDIVDNPGREEMRSRLEAIVQDILSRPRLRRILNQYKLYPEIKGAGSAEIAIRTLRNAVHIRPIRSETGVQMLQTYSLSYTHSEPQTAFLVAKDLTNLFVEESVVTRRSEVKGTEEFIEAQLRSARKKLEETEAKVQAFVSANFGKLPEHLDASVARLQNIQAQLSTNSELIAANITRRSHLENEIAALKKSGTLISADDTGATAVDPRERLAQLESALVVLRSQYSERHPDVKRTQGRIKALKARIAAESNNPGSNTGSVLEPSAANPTLRRLRRELNEIGIKISGLQQENDRLKKTVIQLRTDIEKMPLKEQELLKIKRDYANVKANYERLLAARGEAGLQASLIKSQKATQFRIIQPPELPIIPAGPDRMMILTLGMVGAVVIFFVVPIALFFVNSSYRFRDELEEDLEVPVIGIIPSMDSSYAVQTNMRHLGISMGLSLVVLITGCVVIVFVT